MVAVDYLLGDNSSLMEIIWTGPANGRFPSGALTRFFTHDCRCEISNRARDVRRHRVRHLCDHLIEAVDRSVELTLIVESEDESEGQLTRDAIAAFRNVPTPKPPLLLAACQARTQSGWPARQAAHEVCDC